MVCPFCATLHQRTLFEVIRKSGLPFSPVLQPLKNKPCYMRASRNGCPRSHLNGSWYIRTTMATLHFPAHNNWFTENLWTVFCLLLSAVLCCALLFSAVLCCSLLPSAVLCCSLLFSAVLCCSLLLPAGLWCTLLFSAVIGGIPLRRSYWIRFIIRIDDFPKEALPQNSS